MGFLTNPHTMGVDLRLPPGFDYDFDPVNHAYKISYRGHHMMVTEETMEMHRYQDDFIQYILRTLQTEWERKMREAAHLLPDEIEVIPFKNPYYDDNDRSEKYRVRAIKQAIKDSTKQPAPKDAINYDF